jgi:hypothetical protein
LAQASLGERQVLDGEYGFSEIFTTLFLFLGPETLPRTSFCKAEKLKTKFNLFQFNGCRL